MLGVRGVCAPVCVRTHTGERTLPLCPSRHLTRTKPLSPDWRPKSSSHPGFRLLSTTAPTENGLRNLPSKKGGKKKKERKSWPDPQSPSPAAPLTHLSGYCWGNWHPQPHLENRCRKRQRCTAYSFLHWRKRSPGPTIDLVFPPLPLILLDALPALPAVPCLLLSFLPSFREVSLVSLGRGAEQFNCSVNTD